MEGAQATTMNRLPMAQKKENTEGTMFSSIVRMFSRLSKFHRSSVLQGKRKTENFIFFLKMKSPEGSKTKESFDRC